MTSNLLLPFLLFAAAPAPDYARQVYPVLLKYCVGCHTPEEAKGDLVMTDFKQFVEGGKSGKAFIPGKSAESRLVLMAEGKLRPRMPPKNHPAPSAAELALIKEWIDAGAAGPSGGAETLIYPHITPKKAARASVEAAAISPDGKMFAIGGYGVVTLVDSTTGYIVHELKGHTAQVLSIRFSTDGKLLAAAAGQPGRSGEVKLWNVADGSLVRTFAGHRDAVYALDLSRDGALLATAGYDKVIRVWEVATGKEGKPLVGHNDAVYAVAFAPDRTKLVSASGDRTIKLWDVASGRRLDTFSQPLQDQYTVAFRPDGKQIAAAGADNRIRVWGVSATGAEGSNPLLLSRFAHESPILQLLYSADGKTLVSSAQDASVKLWRGDTVVEFGSLEKQSDWAAGLALSPSGEQLLVGRHDGTTALYDVGSRRKLRDVEPKRAPPKPPLLISVVPRGIQIGGTTVVRVTGKNLAVAGAAIKFSRPEVAAVVNGARDDAIDVQISTPSALTRGSVEFSITTPGGASKPYMLQMDDLPQSTEQEPNDAVDGANALTTPAGVWGVVDRPGDVDFFSFNARRGETLVFDLAARSFGSKLKGSLAVLDEYGRPAAAVQEMPEGVDPLATFTAPADGKYIVQVGDALLAGSAEHFYRLSVGKLPVVLGAYPLGVAARSSTTVELAGANLGGPSAPAAISFTARDPGEAALPLDSRRYRFRTAPKLVVSALPEVLELEPNDAPANATPMPAPGAANGRIWRKRGGPGGDVDCFRIPAKKGESWIVETVAQQRGSPVDTRIEILDDAGRPVQRLVLQAVRDAAVHFRTIDSKGLEIRTTNWTEMELDQFLYMGGEVGKFFRLPQGPDSGFMFYNRGGARISYFDTSATAHALNDPVYIVEPQAVDAKTIPNGLPSFPLYYTNDDSGDRRIGRDSRLTFTAPADGAYVIRISDSRGMGGERFAYRLVVRRPAPDFSVTLGGVNPIVSAGGGREIDVHIERLDGFEDEVEIAVSNLPPGFHVSAPTVVQAGHTDAKMVVFADAKASPPPAAHPKILVAATAKINGATMTKAVGDLGRIQLAPKPKLSVRLEPANVVLAPGATVSAMLHVERNGFKDRISFDVKNLPHGVIVDNIGLSGILIPPGETKRKIFFNARNWVAETVRPCFAVTSSEGNQASPPILLHIQRAKHLLETK